jgi:protein-S-isoprenylcysteine O-methyltransferase Ste14
VLFAGVWIADSFFLRATIVLNAYVPLAIRIPIGAVLLVLSAFLARASLGIIFGETRPEPHVIRKGVFAVVRHPMYLSEILLYLGLLLISLSLAAGAVWLAAIGFLHYVSRAEEKLLFARFGDEYAAYMREVPMWVPRLRRQ